MSTLDPFRGVGLALSALLAAACASPDTTQSAGGTSGLEVAAFSTTAHATSSDADRDAHRASCDAGEGTGCHAAALDAYYSPSSTESDAEALSYFQRGCDGGYAPSCSGLGTLYAEGRGVPQDDTRAAGYFRDACEHGGSTACQSLGDALRHGRGVPLDEAAAARADARSECAFEAELHHGTLADCPAP